MAFNLSSKIPVFKKKVASFLSKEEGKISKEKLIKIGVAAALISSLAGAARGAVVDCSAGSHHDHSSGCDFFGHWNHCSHSSDTVPKVFHNNDCQGAIAPMETKEGSEIQHGNNIIVSGGPIFSGTHNHCSGHNQHCSHASHGSHSSHCSCDVWI